MAFQDITVVLYDGRIKLDYKDKAHRYYVRKRENWDLPEDDAAAWSKIIYPKGTTTLLGDTLEKKGLMTWPMGVALAELFGFYDFTNENGEKMTGFSKDKGTIWPHLTIGNEVVEPLTNKEEYLPIIVSASKNWQRRQKKGADIGSVVHDALEHYIKGQIYDIAENYMWNIKECEYEVEADREQALRDFQKDVDMATKAYEQAVFWWDSIEPELYGTEELLYSEVHNICGTYDFNIGVKREHHPVFKDDDSKPEIINVTGDWKTSNASKSEAACMPEGINYQYFIQDAIYEMMRREMGKDPADDLLVVSARKDGGFTALYASELGLSVQDCIDWAIAVITSYRLMEKTKKGLVAHAEPKEAE